MYSNIIFIFSMVPSALFCAHPKVRSPKTEPIRLAVAAAAAATALPPRVVASAPLSEGLPTMSSRAETQFRDEQLRELRKDLDDAVSNGRFALAQLLLKNGVPSAQYNLFEVIRRKDDRFLKLLLEEKADVHTARKVLSWYLFPSMEYTPLHYAVAYQYTTGINMIAHHGGDINKMAGNFTPFGLACCGQLIDSVEALLALGLDHISYFQGLRHAFENRPKGDPISKKIAQKILMKIDINCDIEGAKCIHHAVVNNWNHSAIRFLIDHRADVNVPFTVVIKNESGAKHIMTPYVYCVLKDKQDVATSLVKAGAHVEMPDDDIKYGATTTCAALKINMRTMPTLMRQLLYQGQLDRSMVGDHDYRQALAREPELIRALYEKDDRALDAWYKKSARPISAIMTKDPDCGIAPWHVAFFVGNRSAALLFMNIYASKKFVLNSSARDVMGKIKLVVQKVTDATPFDPLIETTAGENVVQIAQKRGHWDMVDDMYEYHTQARVKIIQAWRAACPIMPAAIADIAAQCIYGGRAIRPGRVR